MNNQFHMEVNTGSGGYGFTDSFAELLEAVENECGKEEKNKVEKWALNSKENDEYVSENGRMHIWNCGD